MELVLQDDGAGHISLISYDNEVVELIQSILTKSSLNIDFQTPDGIKYSSMNLSLNADEESPYMLIVN